MNSYHLLLLICLAGAIATFIPRIKPYQNHIVLYLCALLTVFAALRWQVGLDFGGYVTIFDLSPTITNLFTNTGLGFLEWGYRLLNSIVKTMGHGVTGVFIVVAVASMTLLYRSLKRYTTYPALALFVYVAQFYFIRDVGRVSFSLALAIVFYAFQFLEDRKFWQYGLLVILAALIHQTALIGLVMLLLYLLFKKGLSLKIILPAVAVALVIGHFGSPDFIRFLRPVLSGRYAHLVTDPSQIVRTGLINLTLSLQLVILVLMLILRKSLQHKFYNLFLMTQTLAVIFLALLSPLGSLGTDYANYFMTPLIVILPMFMEVVTGKMDKILAKKLMFAKYGIAAVIVLYGFLAYQVYFRGEVMGMFYYPYHSILTY